MVDEMEQGVLIPLLREPDDSGIDSDDTERARAQGFGQLIEVIETFSSDEDHQLVSKGLWLRCIKKTFDEQPPNMEDREVLIPMVQWQPPNVNVENHEPNSPDRSSPLYEVELTASDEDDDASLLELVIPIQSAKSKSTPKSIPREIWEFITFFCEFFCCGR